VPVHALLLERTNHPLDQVVLLGAMRHDKTRSRAAGPEGEAAVQDRQYSTAGVGLCCRSGNGL
jgi:hypothetical protein